MSANDSARRSGVAAVLLAAGSSRRFGPDNKLLADIGGGPVVARVGAALARSRIDDIVVVTGPDAARVEAALRGCRARFIHNTAFADGIGGSIATGARAVDSGADGVLVVQGDMPGLTTELIDRLIAAFADAGRSRIVFPMLPGGEQANPVLWPSRYLPELAALSGDRGAKPLIARERAHAFAVRLSEAEAAQLIDVDTPEALAIAARRLADG